MLINIVVMTLGEIEYVDEFLSKDLSPFTVDVLFVLLIFLFLMPVVLMNLMVGQQFEYLSYISSHKQTAFVSANSDSREYKIRPYGT